MSDEPTVTQYKMGIAQITIAEHPVIKIGTCLRIIMWVLTSGPVAHR